MIPWSRVLRGISVRWKVNGIAAAATKAAA
jgi:hypothetical protein